MDYIRDYGHNCACFNIGINTCVVVFIGLILKFQFNGPLMAAVLSVAGFSAMGKHLRNILPVIIGAILAVIISNNSFDNISMQIAVIFVTALAPLSGRYKFIIGIVAGFLHIMILPLVSSLHGGFDLYNNGFSAGFIAAILISIIESFEQEYKYDNKRMQKNK